MIGRLYRWWLRRRLKRDQAGPNPWCWCGHRKVKHLIVRNIGPLVVRCSGGGREACPCEGFKIVPLDKS